MNYGAQLDEHHAGLVAASGISPEVAIERGYRTEHVRSSLMKMQFSRAAARVPALVIPIRDVSGNIRFSQIRPDDPRERKGRPVKYETPSKARLCIDVPPRVRPWVLDPAYPLVITEGARKADAAATAGLCCVDLLGVWNWIGSNGAGGKTALPDWRDIPLNNDRRVLIAYDSDVMAKATVQTAASELAAYLSNRGADVGFVVLPSLEGGRKCGLDDFLADGHDRDDVLALAREHLGTVTPPEENPDVPDEDGAALLGDLAIFLRRFVSFPRREQAHACALWIAHTHAIAAADSTPRLAPTSPEKRSGKTRLLELLTLLVRRGVHTTNISSSSLYRIIDKEQPTLLVDEADALFVTNRKQPSERAEDLRGLIDAGHRRGAEVLRCVGVGADQDVRSFPVFAPVAIAAIGSVPDTIADRAISIRLRRRRPGAKVEPFRYRIHAPEARALQRRVAAWAKRHLDELADARPEMPDGVADRLADVWEPLIAIADVAGGRWPARARRACTKLAEAAADDNDTDGVTLLSDIRSIRNELATKGRDEVFSASLVAKLNDIDESPWGSRRRGNGINANDLARMLRPFEIHSTKLRAGKTTKRGYRLDDFADAFTRYLPFEKKDDDEEGEK